MSELRLRRPVSPRVGRVRGRRNAVAAPVADAAIQVFAAVPAPRSFSEIGSFFAHCEDDAVFRLSTHHAVVALGGPRERELLNHRPHAGQH